MMSGDQSPLARMQGITKSFGATVALAGVDLDLHRGLVHALLGENGAGKTTMMRILAGIDEPDDGAVEIRGRPVRLRGRKDGARQGIGFVQQHYGLVEELTGVENYLLGHPSAPVWLPVGRARRLLAQTAAEFSIQADVDRPVAELTIGQRQQLEILIALTVGADILILDEPTAALGSADIDNLKQILRRLSDEGKSVIYITHKLAEVMEIADAVTVLRKGKVVAQFARHEFQIEALTVSMVGTLPEKSERVPRQLGTQVVALCDVGVGQPGDSFSSLDKINLSVARHEILGVAGVSGNGQESLAEVLCGLIVPRTGAVERQPGAVAYIPEDRARDGIALVLSVDENLIVHKHRDRAFVRRGALSRSVIGQFARNLVSQNNIHAPGTGAIAATLSGGNQQKVVVARELERDPALVVAHNPYRGLDVGASLEVRGQLLAAREAGAGVVLISPDLEDLFDICDRIVVMSGGRIVGSVDPLSTTPHEVGALLGGSVH